MTDQEYKVRENRLRRAAERQGLRLQKSRARDPRALGFGTYQLVDADNNFPVWADWTLGRGYGLDLTEVADYLFPMNNDIPAAVQRMLTVKTKVKRADIEALQLEFSQAGDRRGVDICQDALDGDQAAWFACGEEILYYTRTGRPANA